MKNNLAVKIGSLILKNPVLVASGTFGYASEFEDFMDISALGAVVTKTVTLVPRKGNVPPRTCETPAGMLNSIGLENPGIEVFVQEKIPLAGKYNVPIIVSIASDGGFEEFTALTKRLDSVIEAAGIELNISCPNVKSRGLVAQDPRSAYEAVKAARKGTGKTLIVKLSPNVTDITEIACAVQKAGADAVSLINTLYGMSIDTVTRKSRLGNIIGGLSGPAIKPVALKMVYDVSRSIKIPVIGMGGIISSSDAVEFLVAGATAVSVGTGNFINPSVSLEIITGIERYLHEHAISSIRDLTGSLKI